MKNILNYFYGIKPDNKFIAKDSCDFYFQNKNNLYCFSKLTLNECKRIVEFYNNYVVPRNFHTILLNKDRKIFSKNKEEYYVLMKINCSNKKVTHSEILNYFMELEKNGLIINGTIISWSRLWRSKIDYLEYYVQENQSINFNIKCLCNYFIGISETAISLINYAMNNYKLELQFEQLTFCHERIKKDYTLYDLYNPKNIILDHYSRDISEYLKTLVFDESYNDIIQSIIEEMNFTDAGYILLLARTMFPTFFFDMLNDIDDISFNDKNLIKMYDYINKYENLIFKLYFIIRKKIHMPHIEWLMNFN